jgi:hypothetical protein
VLQTDNQKIKDIHSSNVRESTLAITKRNEDIDKLNNQLNEYNVKFIQGQKSIDNLIRKNTELES